ncbi:fatty acid--CoA ligase family protein [Pseudonocardia ailaonensis]|uniref:Fatty acid--CoA ligase family protein n=1 Tax=Pseudonocardia ailaonensis TaxID=367279 RepID=A0ABN2NJU3_9PSEU
MPISLITDMAAETLGDRVALGRSRDGLTHTALRRAALGGAGLVAASGHRSVAFVGVNGPVVAALLFASAYAGVPFTPLNYRLSAEALRVQLDRLDDPLVVTDAAFRGVVGDRRARPSEDWIADALAAPEHEPTAWDDDATAVVLFTSGTTSEPKRVLLRHANLLSYVLQTVEFASADPQDAILVSVPPYHIAGMGTILSNVYSGRRMVHLPAFAPGAWLDLVRAERITNAMLVPTMLSRLVDELGGAEAGTSSLRQLAYGGARMPRPVLEGALRAFPGVGFTNAYGLTETSSTIAVLGPDDHREALAATDPAAAARLASVGRPVPGVEIEVRGDGGRVLPAGEVGEVWVRGPQVSGEYVGLGSVLDEQGWFPTRDQGHLDAEGFLFVGGRSDDTIIRGGENIAPAEIEDQLVLHASVKDVAVVGLPDDEWGERLVAVVVPAAPIEDVDELTRWVKARVRGSRTPDEIRFADELPYNPTGKLLRRELRARLIAAGGES